MGPLTLVADDVVVDFPVARASLWGRGDVVHAVRGVSMTIGEAETVGVVGESGCGKTTLARSLVGLIEPTRGAVRVGGQDVPSVGRRRPRGSPSSVQMVFQDPFGSLDPRMTIGRSIAEGLYGAGIDRNQRRQRVIDVLEAVGLSASHVDRYPHQFSGGQRQRVGIARALVADPRFVVLDEPISALDVSVQAQILNLLARLQAERSVGFVLVAHDLAAVLQVSDRVMVMYLGKVVEEGAPHVLVERSAHPYTRALLSAIPVPDPTATRTREPIVLVGEPPSPARPPSGCAFRTRCPLATRICADEEPLLAGEVGRHQVACHHPIVTG